MREIKFRGRRKNSSEWVYGAFLAIPKLCSYIYDVQPDGQATRYLVDEDTVGQFTELLDSNGKEIYEGDIVRHSVRNGQTAGPIKGVVLFEDGMFFVREIDGTNVLLYDMIFFDTHVHVISNVHDNPEMMEVAHD